MHRVVLVSVVLGLTVSALGCGRSVNVHPTPQSSELDASDAIALYSDLLNDHVRDDGVDYPALCNDDRLESYIGYLAATDPDTFETRSAQFAFWINAYNAYTLKIICDNYPVGSINDLHFGGLVIGTLFRKTIWKKEFAIVGGKSISLDHIEHGIVRPIFDDPRAHFALVCAARSCPPLQPEAYTRDRLDEQLEEQGRVFLRTPEMNSFDSQTRTAHLSKILDWYKGDFGETDEDLLRSVARYLPEETAREIEANPQDWSINHTKYDWSLNEAPRLPAEKD